MCSKSEEDVSRCTPRSVRGNGGVSILWLNDISTDRVVGIRFVTADRPICFLSVYLSTRTGCTDDFKECMDYLDAVLGRLSFDNDVIIMGDLNADPGSEGGPFLPPRMSRDEYCYAIYGGGITCLYTSMMACYGM